MCDISNYEKLTNAIVIQAAQDYLTETKALKKTAFPRAAA